MARGDLFKIIKDIQGELSSDKRTTIDAYDHVLEMSPSNVAKQIQIQLEEFRIKDREQGKFALTQKFGPKQGNSYEQALASLNQAVEFQPAQDKQIAKELAEEFTKRVFVDLTTTNSKTYNVQVLSGNAGSDYKLKISAIGPGEERLRYGQKVNSISVFDFIRDSGLNGKQLARDYIKNKLNLYLGKNISITNKEKIFDLGHITAVSTFKIAKASVELRQTLGQYTEIAKMLVGFEVLSQFTQIGDPELSKVFEGKVAYVKPESKSYNNLQATYETMVLVKLNNAIKNVLKDNREWEKQGGSDNLETAIAKELMLTAKKRGAKVKVSGKQTKTVTKAKKDVKVDLNISTTKIRTSPGSIPLVRATKRSAVNLQNLIPMLNQKLPELVKQNMGQGGRLRNRTGRFAESVEVVSVSNDGFNIGFTYQTDPYAVFEGQGNRDPRSLIDLSIRQAAAGIMSTRFSTGRVR